MCLGYWDDDEANAKLFTADGWMLMGDIVEVDEEGYLRVVGRTSEFIIRGGKNLSAPAIEAEVGIPVTSSDHALAWHSLRLAGVTDRVPGAGRLFECGCPGS